MRFTLAGGTAVIVVGLVLPSPLWLAAMALVAVSRARVPDAVIIDVV